MVISSLSEVAFGGKVEREGPSDGDAALDIEVGLERPVDVNQGDDLAIE